MWAGTRLEKKTDYMLKVVVVEVVVMTLVAAVSTADIFTLEDAFSSRQ